MDTTSINMQLSLAVKTRAPFVVEFVDAKGNAKRIVGRAADDDEMQRAAIARGSILVEILPGDERYREGEKTYRTVVAARVTRFTTDAERKRTSDSLDKLVKRIEAQRAAIAECFLAEHAAIAAQKVLGDLLAAPIGSSFVGPDDTFFANREECIRQWRRWARENGGTA